MMEDRSFTAAMFPAAVGDTDDEEGIVLHDNNSNPC